MNFYTALKILDAMMNKNQSKIYYNQLKNSSEQIIIMNHFIRMINDFNKRISI